MNKKTHAVAAWRADVSNDRYVYRRDSFSVVALHLVSTAIAVLLAVAMILAIGTAVLTSR